MKKKITINEIIFGVSVIFAIVTAILLITINGFYTNFKLLMLACYIALNFVPYLIRWIFKVKFPSYINCLYWLFIALTTLAGTIYGVYDLIPYYDVAIHFFSGVLVGGFAQYILDKNPSTKNMNLALKVLFIIGFACMIGVIWELWEYFTDELLSLNSQRHTSPDGIEYVGHNAISNTIYDLFADLLGGVVFGVSYMIVKIRYKKNNLKK